MNWVHFLGQCLSWEEEWIFTISGWHSKALLCAFFGAGVSCGWAVVWLVCHVSLSPVLLCWVIWVLLKAPPFPHSWNFVAPCLLWPGQEATQENQSQLWINKKVFIQYSLLLVCLPNTKTFSLGPEKEFRTWPVGGLGSIPNTDWMIPRTLSGMTSETKQGVGLEHHKVWPQNKMKKGRGELSVTKYKTGQGQ